MGGLRYSRRQSTEMTPLTAVDDRQGTPRSSVSPWITASAVVICLETDTQRVRPGRNRQREEQQRRADEADVFQEVYLLVLSVLP